MIGAGVEKLVSELEKDGGGDCTGTDDMGTRFGDAIIGIRVEEELVSELEDDWGGGCTCIDEMGTGFGDAMIGAAVEEELGSALENDGGGDCTWTDGIETEFCDEIIDAGVEEELAEKDGFSATGIDDKCETETEIGGMGTLVGGITPELENWEDEGIPSTLTSGP